MAAQCVRDHEHPCAGKVAFGKRSRSRDDAVTVALQQIGERLVTSRRRVKVGVRFVEHDNRMNARIRRLVNRGLKLESPELLGPRALAPMLPSSAWRLPAPAWATRSDEFCVQSVSAWPQL